jgi:hypothetical protein
VQLKTEFEVDCPHESAIEIAARDETLLGLFPDSETEIVASEGDHKTTRTHYTALGRSGVATFHFTYLLDGDVRFEKECDGNVWRELRGKLSFLERGERTCVCIEMEGRTKSLVPEFTIKGPMRDQLDQMARALRARLQSD